MKKKARIKEVVIREGQTRPDYKRMDLAAEKYGIAVASIKAFFNTGKLTRYKLNSMTFVDCRELEALIRPDEGNHGPQAAPRAAQG